MMTNTNQRLTQGQFSFLPDLSDTQITAQLEYALAHGWAIGLEYTDDPHPRNTYWEMFGNPMFDANDAAAVMSELRSCRQAFPRHYIRVTAFDATRGWETVRMSYLVNRPPVEPGFGLSRTEMAGRDIRYRIVSYATERPEGERY